MAVRASPAVRFNLAIAARNTGRFVEALDQFRTFLREGADGADATRRAAAAREVDALTTRVARLTVRVQGDAPQSFQLDGRALPLALIGAAPDPALRLLGAIALGFALFNVVGGFLVTDSMLAMFQSRHRPAKELS